MLAQISVGALVLLGLVGGSLILAYSGFVTSPKRGGAPTFVPLPQAYVLVATMYGMSWLALGALLQAWATRLAWSVAAFITHALLAVGCVALLRSSWP